MSQDKPHQGWQCPICKKILAPWVRECDGNHNIPLMPNSVPIEIPKQPEIKPHWWPDITCSNLYYDRSKENK